jgi:hypothetical protein
MTPVKATNKRERERELSTAMRFKETAGTMTLGLWCKSHDLSGRLVHDLFELDSEAGSTALQIFTERYKAIPRDQAFQLLRKARRLDALEHEKTATNDPIEVDWDAVERTDDMGMGRTACRDHIIQGARTAPDVKPSFDDIHAVARRARRCAACGVAVSPRWHKSGAQTECHRCWYASAGPGHPLAA